MPRFYGRLKGTRGEVTRLGHTGLVACANGWNIGAEIELYRDKGDRDRVRIYLTSGSNASAPRRLLGDYPSLPDEPTEDRIGTIDLMKD